MCLICSVCAQVLMHLKSTKHCHSLQFSVVLMLRANSSILICQFVKCKTLNEGKTNMFANVIGIILAC